MWKSMGLVPLTKITYHVIIDPMSDDAEKINYSTESKLGMYWFVIKQFTKEYIRLLKTDKEFIRHSIRTSEKLKEQGVEATFVKKPHYKNKYKKNSRKVKHYVEPYV